MTLNVETINAMEFLNKFYSRFAIVFLSWNNFIGMCSENFPLELLRHIYSFVFNIRILSLTYDIAIELQMCKNDRNYELPMKLQPIN